MIKNSNEYKEIQNHLENLEYLQGMRCFSPIKKYNSEQVSLKIKVKDSVDVSCFKDMIVDINDCKLCEYTIGCQSGIYLRCNLSKISSKVSYKSIKRLMLREISGISL